jgi:stage II sporulation protein D
MVFFRHKTKIFILILIFFIAVFLNFLAAVSKNDSDIQDFVKEKQTFKIHDASKNEILDLSAWQITCYAVLAEMPASFECEALKAQAVAAFTYFLHQIKNIKAKNKLDLDYDLSVNNLSTFYILNFEDACKKWGAKSQEYEKKIKSCIDQVAGKYIADTNGEPILALFHASSHKATNDCADVFGGIRSYLKSVSSPEDKITLHEIPKNDFYKIIIGKNSNIPQTNAKNWIENVSKTKNNFLKKITICGKEITGKEFRNLFNLPSSNISVKYKKDTFYITAFGCGHGVGMSQHGANCYAKQGKNYEQILKHYYPGTKIKNI